MKKLSFEERYADEILTDNTALDECRQCKDCAFRDDGTVWSNHYQKACCEIYQHPGFKPIGVMLNKEICDFHLNLNR